MIKRLRKLERVRVATSMIPATIEPSAVIDALLSMCVKLGSAVLVHPDAIVATQFPALCRLPKSNRSSMAKRGYNAPEFS